MVHACRPQPSTTSRACRMSDTKKPELIPKKLKVLRVNTELRMPSMDVNFAQIYPEIDTHFRFTNTVLRQLKGRMNSLNQHFLGPRTVLKTDHYSIIFTISATRGNDALEICGPIFHRQDKSVEFVLHIPYRQISDFTEELHYALDSIGEALCRIFKDNHADSSGIAAIVDEMKGAIKEDPETYKKWLK